MNNFLEHIQQLNALFAETEQKLMADINIGIEREQALQLELQQLRSEQESRNYQYAQQLEATNVGHFELLRQQTEREQSHAAQVLSIQQRAVIEKNELREQQHTQLQEIQRQHAEHEWLTAERIHTLNQELHRLLMDKARREQEIAAQLLTIQQNANTEKAELSQQQQTHLQDIQRHHAEREQALTQQHDIELSTRQTEHNHLTQVHTAFEAKLKAEILSEQQISLRLHQTLAEVRQILATIHASLTWRMTAPLRAFASLIAPKKNSYFASSCMVEANKAIINAARDPQSINATQVSVEPIIPATTNAAHSHTPFHEMDESAPSPQAIMPSVSESQPINIQHTSIETIMDPSAHSSIPSTPVSTLDELLSYHDQQFVRCAYQTLLGREPDHEGLGYYLGRLRTGFSKMQILAQLRLSKEGETYVANLPGLSTAIQRYQRGQSPLVGWLFRLIEGTESNHPVERKLRAIEHQIVLLNNESNHRFNQMEETVSVLHQLAVQQTQSVVAVLSEMHQINTDAVTRAPVNPSEPNGVKQLSSRARDIYFQLKTAAAIHAKRTT